MAEAQDAPDPDTGQIFDDASHTELVCRVCGALVPRDGGHDRVHWDWHEAANGA
jgi:hypothetical protein